MIDASLGFQSLKKGMRLEKVEAVSAALHDGLLRVALSDLLSANLTHLVSGLNVAPGVQQCGTVSAITGYTEWVGEMPGASISLGWDWCLEPAVCGDVTCVRMGLPYSNVMLVDTANRDYGWNRNLEILASVVDAMPWADQTQRSLQQG